MSPGPWGEQVSFQASSPAVGAARGGQNWAAATLAWPRSQGSVSQLEGCPSRVCPSGSAECRGWAWLSPHREDLWFYTEQDCEPVQAGALSPRSRPPYRQAEQTVMTR